MKKKIILITVILVITLLSAQCVLADSKCLDVRNASQRYDSTLGYFDADEVEEGAKALTNGDFAKALVSLSPAAEAGNAYGQYYLGVYYLVVEENYEKAVMWYRRSAAQGYTSAKIDLAMCYFSGSGVQKNDYEAFELFKAAAEQGDPEAMDNLVICYYNGL